MSTAADEVWALLRELVQSQKETDRQFQETDRKMRELSQETDRRFKETDRKFQETDRKMRELSQETDRRFKETERMFQETGRRFQETERMVKNLSKNLGDLGNRLGEFVEYMVAPAVVRLFQKLGIAVHEVHPQVKSKRNGEGIEIDLLVINDNVLVALECKSKLTREHVDEHLARMERLKRLLPSYQHHQAIGAVAAMVVDESVRDYAINQGFYVLSQNGEQVEISNPIGFEPRKW